VTVAIDDPATFVEEGKPLRRERPQRPPLALFDLLAYLPLGGAVQAGVRNLGLPVLQKLVLFRETGEDASLQGIVLGVLDTTFDFAFVSGRIRLGGKEDPS